MKLGHIIKIRKQPTKEILSSQIKHYFVNELTKYRLKQYLDATKIANGDVKNG